jgi:hypothetical protein
MANHRRQYDADTVHNSHNNFSSGNNFKQT